MLSMFKVFTMRNQRTTHDLGSAILSTLASTASTYASQYCLKSLRPEEQDIPWKSGITRDNLKKSECPSKKYK